MTGEFVTAGHLGGYVAGGDPDTMEPALWHWLVDDCAVETVIDVGCGDGAALQAFRTLGCGVLGIDGVPQDDPDIVTHDFTTGPYIGATDADLVWSCEFVEHVDARYEDNYLAVFARAPLILMTHALPGQPGWHHVNCQPPDYWIAALATYGYQLDPELTAETRDRANGYYHRTGLAFVRTS